MEALVQLASEAVGEALCGAGLRAPENDDIFALNMRLSVKGRALKEAPA